MSQPYGWKAVDLDGTLAEYHGWRGPEHIGAPIPAMVERVKKWLAEGEDVRIFTARVDGGQVAIKAGNMDGHAVADVEYVKSFIEAWCIEHIGQCLPITNVKDYGTIEIWDDRAVAVEHNTGRDKADYLEAMTQGDFHNAAHDALEITELRERLSNQVHANGVLCERIKELENPPFKPTHRHWKGDLYQVLHMGTNANDGVGEGWLVIVYRNEAGKVFTRWEADFNGNALNHGELVRRFTPLD